MNSDKLIAEQNKWIDVEERKPENDNDVLVIIKNIRGMQISFYRHNLGHWGGKNLKVTHWMPLPSPPKTDNHG